MSDMKTAILYASPHHHNTEKLVKAIAEKYPDITLIDTTKAKMIALANYDMIGIASGIYFGKFHKSLLEFITENLPLRKKVFLMYTCGNDNKKYAEEMKKFLEQKSATVTGVFSCKGYDTYGHIHCIKRLFSTFILILHYIQGIHLTSYNEDSVYQHIKTTLYIA